MEINTLNAISPIDGRYWGKSNALSNYFSEEALIKNRILVEIEYFISLCEIPLPQLKDFPKKLYSSLTNIYSTCTSEEILHVKEIENVTNHDVKAVEYFIKEKFEELNIEKYKEFIHFGLTSQDINNTAIPLSIKNALYDVYIPHLDSVIKKLEDLKEEYKDITILAHTHGQPASPTLLGREIDVYLTRLLNERENLVTVKHSAKFGGATGGFNAHFVAYKNIDWRNFGKSFVENKLGLSHSFPTTQIEHYDNISALCNNLSRINTILLDLNRDFWSYISMNYFQQKVNKKEVGSSAMPHKINPIDFENSEGNLGIANALFDFFSAKLPISRLQRDLTDSTVLRNIGVPFAHTIVAIQATLKGLNKLVVNTKKINADLEDNWIVISEAIQTILRREAYPNPYEKLKELTRNNEVIGEIQFQNFIDNLEVNESVKKELKEISPYNYHGIK